ncbi:MAG: Lipopolysaccharide export system ATP-binding protein LptB [Acidimicrobiales bacterium]|nr:MAG: ABC transporter ATP-binding protein [Actinomycetota bacterium]MBV6508036.1 Lipopolysaccharide export system ATP-binding protein LptB [Acidimicrobiales bacterium]RIK05335.1 MAG: ABC transporter ATP-binding protein [Acidobacteriota bacterium]
MSPLLALTDVTVTFGGVHAVDHVSLDVEHGSMTGLIGPNGAGKTTLIDAVTGFVELASGRIDFDGSSIERLPAHRRSWRGLARTFQSLELLEDLTVRENLTVAAEMAPWWSALASVARRKAAQRSEAVEIVLASAGLARVADVVVTELSHGQRKLVTVARALVARPKLVILDEPAAGLDSGERGVLRRLLVETVEGGTTILLVDHDMGLVLEVCDTIWVLDFGSVLSAGPPGEVRKDPRVIEAYLGLAEEAAADGIEGDGHGAG